MKKEICLIAAMAQNRVIGLNNSLPWRGQMRADMRRFRTLTWGQTIIMGRKTYESIGHPLTNRTMMILSRQTDWSAPAGVIVVSSLDKVLAATDGKIFVAGGESAYRQTLPLADEIRLTFIDARFPGDSFFPTLDTSWKEVWRQDFPADKFNLWNYSFLTYRRRDTIAL